MPETNTRAYFSLVSMIKKDTSKIMTTNCITFLLLSMMLSKIKLYCLSLMSFYSKAYYLKLRPGVNPSYSTRIGSISDFIIGQPKHCSLFVRRVKKTFIEFDTKSRRVGHTDPRGHTPGRTCRGLLKHKYKIYICVCVCLCV